jgi:hypothetical protein
VKEGLQSWFSHVESDKVERVEQLKKDMEEEQVRVRTRVIVNLFLLVF